MGLCPARRIIFSSWLYRPYVWPVRRDSRAKNNTLTFKTEICPILSIFEGRRSVLAKFSHIRGHSPRTILARIGRPMNALTTLSLTVFTQKNFVADCLQLKCTFCRKTAILFFSYPIGGNRSYSVSSRIGDGRLACKLLYPSLFFIRLIGLDSAYGLPVRDSWTLSLSVTVRLRLRRHERISIESWRFCSNRVSLAQNFRYKSHPPLTIMLVGKLD